MDIKNYRRRECIYIIFREVDEIAAVFTEIKTVEKYISLHRKYFPGVDIDFIHAGTNIKIYNFYPTQKMRYSGNENQVENSIAEPPTDEPCLPPTEKIDGYILVLEGFKHIILGVAKTLKIANSFADEYLIAFPDHTIEFIQYQKNMVFQPIWREENGKVRFLF